MTVIRYDVQLVSHWFDKHSEWNINAKQSLPLLQDFLLFQKIF